MKYVATTLLLLLTAGVSALASTPVAAAAQNPEEAYYSVEYFSPPEGEVVEVGGMDFLPNGDLLVSSRRGRVWWVENPLADNPADARWHIFAEGLYEGLGLSVVDGEIYVVQRGELSILRDHDGDRVCDEVEVVTMDWGMTGNYHEFAYGLPRDLAGNFYLSLNVGFWSPEWWHGISKAPYRGWILQVTPAGEVRPYANGVRSPAGLGVNSAGDVFYTDNQGDWMAVCPIFHVKEGAFYGHPGSLRWTEEYGYGQRAPSSTVPPQRERQQAAVWIPYEWSRSAGNLVEDQSGGKFGPYAGQMFVAELTNGMVLRTQMEKVRGEYQGAVFLFRQQIGSITRIAFAPDGSLFTGFTNRGWGGRGPAHGLGRVRWSGDNPFDFHSVSLLDDGFELRFTDAVAVPETVAGIEAELYDYNYWWDYGSPIQNNTPLRVAAVERGADDHSLIVRLDGLEAARCVKIALPQLRSVAGQALLHDAFHYTLSQMRSGPVSSARVNRVVAPPAVKVSESEGWLHLTWGDATGMWDSSGWELVDVELDPADPTRLITRAGMGALVNSGPSPSNYVSRQELGDYEFRFRFMLPKGGDSGLYFMERYELQLNDSPGEIGGVWGVQSPMKGSRAYQGPGNWHTMTGRFFAPRFDADGNKVRNAKVEAVAIDDVVVMATAQPLAPTGGGEAGEVARAPLRFQGGAGKVCLGDIRVKALDDASRLGVAPGAPALDLLANPDLAEWQRRGNADWQLADGVLRVSGGAGWMTTASADWRDFELRLRMAVNEGGDAGLHFRFDGVRGYQAEVNCTPNALTKTGSLVGLADIHTDLIPGGTLFEYVVRCQQIEAGCEVRIFLNGVEVNHYLDTTDGTNGGHLALEIRDGTELTVESFSARRL